MTEPVTVRLAMNHDLPAILTIAQQTLTAPQWTEAQYANLLLESGKAVPSRMVFVAEESGMVGGFCVLSVAADQSELESIVVARENQRKGMGHALNSAAFHWAQSRGAVEVWLEVRESNAAARALYRSLGFDVSGRRKGYYADPREDAIVMRAILGGATHI